MINSNLGLIKKVKYSKTKLKVFPEPAPAFIILKLDLVKK